MTTAATVDARSAGLNALAFARRFTEGLLNDFPQDKMTFQPFDGANHVLWNLGHIAWTDDYFLSALGNRPSGLPENWSELFGMGSTPTGDAGAYPSLAEVRAVFDERRAAVTEWFQSMDDARLAEPLSDELKGFAANFATLISSLAAHECMHNGQIICIRKALGVKPIHG